MFLLRKLALLTVCAFGAVLMAYGLTATAAATPTMQLTVGPDPTESITTQLGATVSGANASTRLWVNVKPAGGEPCAANPSADHGTNIINEYEPPEHAPAYSDTANHTFYAAGSYLLCGWLAEPGNPQVVLVNPSMTIAVRRPHLSLSIAVPRHVAPSQTFQISMIAQAEATRQAWEYLLPDTGQSCPANAAAAAQAGGARQVLSEWNVTGGPLTETKNETLTTVGAYWVCGYFEYPNTQAAPELAASAQTTVIVPPPPCVVPSFTTRMRLSTVERRIRAGHCTVGKIDSTPSRTVRRGAVVRLSPSRGSKHASGTAVNITLSSGPPCVVPSLGSGLSLKTMERRIVAAHCSVGTISYSSTSRAKRGTVIRLTPRPGTTLSPHAAVQVLVSSGGSRHHKHERPRHHKR